MIKVIEICTMKVKFIYIPNLLVIYMLFMDETNKI